MADVIVQHILLGARSGLLIGGGAFMAGYALRYLLRLFNSLSNY